jgi:hypothetical protein
MQITYNLSLKKNYFKENSLQMNADINTKNQFSLSQQWISSKLPGSEIKESRDCSSSTVYLFQRTMDNLRGVFIRGGETNEEELSKAMKELIQKHGPISIIFDSEKFYLLAYEYLPQAQTENKSLGGRSINPQQAVPTQPKEQFSRPLDHYRPIDIAYPVAVAQSLSAKTTQAIIGKAFALSQSVAKESIAQLQHRIQSNRTELAELNTQFKCDNIPTSEKDKRYNVLWHGEFKPSGPIIPIKGALDSIVKSGSLAEFDKLFPGFRNNGKYISDHWDKEVWRSGGAWTTDGQGLNSYAIHKETGIVIYNGFRCDGDKCGVKGWSDHNCDIKTLEGIAKYLEEIEKLKNEKATAQQTRIEAEEKFKKNLIAAEKTLLEAEKKYARAALVMDVYIQHAPLDQAIGHIANLAINMQNQTAYEALRCASLGNNLIMNVRLLGLQLAEFREMQKSEGSIKSFWSVGGAIGTLNPILACISIYSSIIALTQSPALATSPALSQKEFFDVINKSMLPLINDVQESMAEGNRRLANQTDAQTTTVLKSLAHFQNELSKLLKGEVGKVNEKLDDKTYHDFVAGAQLRVDTYRNALSEAAKYIKGKVVGKTNWFTNYCEKSAEVLKDAKSPSNNGFNHHTPVYQIDRTVMGTSYSSGVIHHSIYGDVNAIPPELSMLYSITHTFILVVKTLLQNERICGIYNTDKINDLLELANKINKGVDEQLKLFNQLEPQFDEMLKSYETFIKWMQNNKSAVEKAKKDKLPKVYDWYLNCWNKVADTFVGSEMFNINNFVHKPMKLISVADKIKSEIDSRVGMQLPIFFHALVAFDNLRNPQRNWSAAYFDSYLTADVRTAKDLVRTNCGKSDNPPPFNLIRRIWSVVGGGFYASATITAPPLLPLSALITNTEVNLVKDLPPYQGYTTLDCTVTYISKESRMELSFDPKSLLKENDLKNINEVPKDSASNRKNLIYSVLNLLIGAVTPIDALNNFKNRFEICYPLVANADMPLLPLPKTLMEQMRVVLCSELDKLSLAGATVDFRYTFVESGDKYQLNIHAVYGSNQIPFISCCIVEFDTVTVEAFKKQNVTGAKVNFTEFLYTTLFTSFSKDDGLPGNQTYFNKDKTILAPVLVSFPGLFYILEKTPHICFSFAHSKYNHDACMSLWNVVNKQKADENIVKQFFKKVDIKVDKDNFMKVQKVIQQKRDSIKESVEYKAFKKRYDSFMALSKLACSLDNDKTRGLLSSDAGIILPGEDFWLEQAFFHEAPQKEKLDGIRQVLKAKRSPAKIKLELYAQQMSEIVKFLNKYNSAGYKSDFIPMAMQSEFATSIGFDGPLRARAKLEKDTTQTQKSVGVGAASDAPKGNPPLGVQSPNKSLSLANGYTLKVYNTKGDGSCGFHALVGEIDKQSGQHVADAAKIRQEFSAWLSAQRENGKLPSRIQNALHQLLVESNDAPVEFNKNQDVIDARKKLNDFILENDLVTLKAEDLILQKLHDEEQKAKLVKDLDEKKSELEGLAKGEAAEQEILTAKDKLQKAEQALKDYQFVAPKKTEKLELLEKEFAKIVLSIIYDPKVFEAYLNCMKHVGYYLFQDELAVVASFLKKKLYLFQEDWSAQQNPIGYSEVTLDGAENIVNLDPSLFSKDTVCVYYHGKNHYERAEVVIK